MDLKMKYDVITIDSEAIEHNGFHFDNGLLNELKQFKEGPIEVIISSVIINELIRRLSEKTREAKDSLAAALKRATDYGIATGEASKIDQNIDPKEIAKKRLISFLHDIGAQSIKVDKVSTRDVLRLYLAPSPPFSGTGKKKHEFPDAIALLSLEAWADENDKKIVAVTKDSDWKAFAANSKCRSEDILNR
jgi:rRNA-processing protein FCF1